MSEEQIAFLLVWVGLSLMVFWLAWQLGKSHARERYWIEEYQREVEWAKEREKTLVGLVNLVTDKKDNAADESD